MTISRITNKLMSNRSIENLRLNLQRLNDLQNKLSSGQNITSPSDDPIGLSRLLGIDDTLKQDERYSDNINNAKSELNTTDALLSSVTDIIQRSRELTIQASSQNNGPDELSAIREEIQQLMNQAVQIANTKFGEKYIFGGRVTTQAPFTQAGTNVTYNGSVAPNYSRQVEIGNGVTITVNFAGDSVFGQYDGAGPAVDSGLFNTFATLINDLNTAIATPTSAAYDTIRAHIDDFDNDLDNILSVQTTTGALVNRLELTENRIQDRNIALSKEYGSIQDVDLAKIISDLNFQEAVFQTSLSATSRVLQPTLLNYLS